MRHFKLVHTLKRLFEKPVYDCMERLPERGGPAATSELEAGWPATAMQDDIPNRRDAQETIKAMIGALHQGDESSAQSCLERLKVLLQHQDLEHPFSQLHRWMEAFEFARAEQVLRQLARALGLNIGSDEDGRGL